MNKNIPLFKVYMNSEAPEAAADVLRSGFIGEGPQVKEFEKELLQTFKNEPKEFQLIVKRLIKRKKSKL